MIDRIVTNYADRNSQCGFTMRRRAGTWAINHSNMYVSVLLIAFMQSRAFLYLCDKSIARQVRTGINTFSVQSASMCPAAPVQGNMLGGGSHFRCADGFASLDTHWCVQPFARWLRRLGVGLYTPFSEFPLVCAMARTRQATINPYGLQ